jgi:hypothetical protein
LSFVNWKTGRCGDRRGSKQSGAAMHKPAAIVRFVGMLSCPDAENVSRECIRSLARVARDVKRWDVCVQPPLPTWPLGGYAVRVHACMDDDSVISIRSQACELLEAVRDAFEGVEEWLEQQQPDRPDGSPAWLPTVAGNGPALPA